MNLTRYNKFLVAIVGAAAQVASQFYGSNHYVQMALAFLTAVGVLTVPNKQ